MQNVVGSSTTTWVMLAADDYHLETRGTSNRTGLITFFVICMLLGVLFSKGKTSGGDTLTWVGFELLHKSYRLDISQWRAEWFCRWYEETATAETINASFFEEGLGTITYVAGALEHKRSFLSPLHKFLALHPRGSVRRVPSYIRFILKYFASEVSGVQTF